MLDRNIKMIERNAELKPFSIMQGGDTFYVVIRRFDDGYGAINLEKFAIHEEALVFLPWGSAVTEADHKRVFSRFEKTYQKIVETYSDPTVLVIKAK